MESHHLKRLLACNPLITIVDSQITPIYPAPNPCVHPLVSNGPGQAKGVTVPLAQESMAECVLMILMP